MTGQSVFYAIKRRFLSQGKSKSQEYFCTFDSTVSQFVALNQECNLCSPMRVDMARDVSAVSGSCCSQLKRKVRKHD